MKKRTMLVNFILAIILLAGCAAQPTNSENNGNQSNVGSTGGGDSQNENAPQENGEDNNNEEAEEPETNEEEPGNANEYAVGEMFNIDEWDVTLDSFEFEQKVSGEFVSSSADEGNKFLILNLTVTNKGTSSRSFIEMFGGISIKAIYDEKYEYSNSITLIDGDLAGESVAPLAKLSGFTVLEMPDQVVEATEGLKLQFKYEGEEIIVPIR
ncbi:DUF4352 domain-containing protein [Paenibacillus senegalensis]|uniref:DUF4352 domain-containing protein n=1 Tax=Paenibacillus senegalensis TaxID=1465766 RepID=UPI0002886FB0|nr:DUF4352 domain-containing protein [Paenibacillus senegalensis]